MWAKDLEKSEKAGVVTHYQAHFYWHLRQLCCPYAQIDPDAELESTDLNAHEETRQRYHSPDHPCWDCLPFCRSLFHEHEIPAVPFSQRLMAQVSLKRAHLRSVGCPPVRDGLVWQSEARMWKRRCQLLDRLQRTDLALDDLDPRPRTRNLRSLFGEVDFDPVEQ